MEVGKRERLNQGDAHNEANLLKAKLAEMLKREPNSEDYQKAFDAVEEMRRVASEEPNFDKIVFKIFQIGNRYFNNAADGLLWVLTLGERPDQSDEANREWHLRRFDDASSRLRELGAEAERLESTNGESEARTLLNEHNG